MELTAALDAYGAAWNETDAAKRRALLDEAWADHGVYCDPTARVEGRDALDAHIARFTERMAGSRIENTSRADEHDGWFRFSWRMIGPDGTTAVEGFDVGRRTSDGRIDLIVGFFGPFPPLEAG